MTIARLDRVTKRFGSRWIRTSLFKSLFGAGAPGSAGGRAVLEEVSLEIGAGERWGLAGPNGSGKTTLLKILAGILRPSAGEVRVEGGVTPFFSWNVGFLDDLDGRENVLLFGTLLGMGRRDLLSKFDAIFDFAGLEAGRRAKLRTYSAGMKARLAMAVGLQTDARLLLFDEIFSVSDVAFQERCFAALDRLSAEGRSMIIASHDPALLRRLASKCLVLDAGRVVASGGPP